MARTPIHPGEHLAEMLDELDMSAAGLARQLKVPTNRITEIMNGQRAVTGDTALRLGHFFGTSAQFCSTCRHSTSCAAPSKRRARALMLYRHWRTGKRNQAASGPSYCRDQRLAIVIGVRVTEGLTASKIQTATEEVDRVLAAD